MAMLNNLEFEDIPEEHMEEIIPEGKRSVTDSKWRHFKIRNQPNNSQQLEKEKVYFMKQFNKNMMAYVRAIDSVTFVVDNTELRKMTFYEDLNKTMSDFNL